MILMLLIPSNAQRKRNQLNIYRLLLQNRAKFRTRFFFAFYWRTALRDESNTQAMLRHTRTELTQSSRTKAAFAVSRRQLHALLARMGRARRQL